MAFSIEDDYLLGALVLLLVVAIVWLIRDRDKHHKNGSFVNKSMNKFTVIPPPATGWDNARGGEVYGGTVPGWGEDYSRPPY